jgi:hypothetical protein
MAQQLEAGDILQISDSKRMVYRGDGNAQMELYYPVSNSWKSEGYCKVMPLTAAQITFWLSKK